MSDTKTIFSEYPIKILNPDDAHYFFGYYDLMPFNSDGSRHLSYRVPFLIVAQRPLI